MTLNLLKDLLWFFGGISLFIYGLQTMAKGLQKIAGSKTKKMLAMLTNNRLSGILVGALVTALIQSSSATTVMVVGFVNAQIMNLFQAVGVIMGANIGTTVTGWIVAMPEWGVVFKPELISTALLILGTLLTLFHTKKNAEEAIHVSDILIGFGIVFIGLYFMSTSVAPYAQHSQLADFFTTIGRNPFLALLVGIVVTALVQTSSASLGILQTLAYNGIINWGCATFVILGQNIGTCVTALLSCRTANKNAQRAAVVHLLFNVIGALLVGSVALAYFMMQPAMATVTINGTLLATFHTCFNVVTTLILLPFTNSLVSLSKKIIPDDGDMEQSVLVKLDERLLQTPGFALAAVRQEVNKMGQIALENVKYTCDVVVERKHAHEMNKNQKKIKIYEKGISDFLNKIDTTDLTNLEQLKLKNTILCLSDIDRISDHCMDIVQIVDGWMINKAFSKIALNDIRLIQMHTYNTLKFALQMRATKDEDLYTQVRLYASNVDQMEESMREGHTQRLMEKQCTTEIGVSYMDILYNYERISCHAKQIAQYTLEEEK